MKLISRSIFRNFRAIGGHFLRKYGTASPSVDCGHKISAINLDANQKMLAVSWEDGTLLFGTAGRNIATSTVLLCTIEESSSRNKAGKISVETKVRKRAIRGRIR